MKNKSEKLYARRKELDLDWDDYEGKAAFEEEYQQEIKETLQTLEATYPPEIIKLLAAIVVSNSLGTTTTGIRFRMGLCGTCYRKYEAISREFVDNVVENS